MNIWLEVAKALFVMGIVALIFYVGTLAGDLRATVEFNETFSAMTMKWMRDRQEKIRLIALMKCTGRKKREERKKLKKQASLMKYIAKDTAESNAIIFLRMIALRNALGEIYVQCSKSTWQQKRIRHILKKHGVTICRKSLE